MIVIMTVYQTQFLRNKKLEEEYIYLVEVKYLETYISYKFTVICETCATC